MKKRVWAGGAAVALVAIATGMWFVAHSPSGSVERFLARHWTRPLPPQGDPPPQYSALEASLASKDCGACHPKQYDDWRTSLHARAVGPGILWQFRIMNQSEANECLRCHAPLAEQKALAALEQGWPGAPTAAPPAYVTAGLYHEGLTCAACHVRKHRRFGPPPRTVPTAGTTPAHGGFESQPAFEDSRFCAVCHQFPPEARQLNGKPLENTYEEWRASPAARAGLACQGCHMPDRRHLWRGIHDPAMVRQGLKRELEVERVDGHTVRVSASVRSVAVGHDFPTYAVPKIYVGLYLQRSGQAPRELVRKVIGRTLNVNLDREISDTRLRPGEALELAADASVPIGEATIELRIDVAPADHYERMFQEWRTRPDTQNPHTAALLREALAEATASRYRLDSLIVPLPRRTGERQRRADN